MRSSILFSLAAAALPLVLACSHEQPAPRAATNDVGYVTITGAPVATAPQSDQVLNVGPNLRAACGIDDASRAPKFDFDKAKLSGNDRDVASRVATCMTSGPMRDKSVWLIGRTDPRGTDQHNMALGQERADAFRSYLVSLGVEASRLQDSSRGAMDAQGTNEGTWRQDRRVDIEVAQ